MTNLSLARALAISKKHLKVRKVNPRRIPHLLTDIQKKTRVTMAKRLLKMYPKYSKKAFDNIVTGVMRTGCIILNQNGRLLTEYGPLKCQTPKYCQTNTNGKEGFSTLQ